MLTFVYLVLSAPLLNRPINHDEVYNTLCYLDALPFSAPTDITSNKKITDQFYMSWRTDWERQIALHPPFVSLFYSGWTRLFGDSELSLHLPPFLIGFVGILLLYQIGSFFLKRDAVFAASLATACSITWIGYSVQAVHAMFEAGIFLIALFFFCRYVRSGERKDLTRLQIANLFGILIFYHFVIFLMVQTLFLFLSRKKYSLKMDSFVLMGLVFILYGILFLSNYYAGGFDYPWCWSKICPETFQQTVSGLPFQLVMP